MRLRNGPLSAESAVDIVIRAAQALQAAHAAHIVHRDIERGEPDAAADGLLRKCLISTRSETVIPNVMADAMLTTVTAQGRIVGSRP